MSCTPYQPATAAWALACAVLALPAAGYADTHGWRLSSGVDVGTTWLGADGFVDTSPWLAFAGGPIQWGVGAPLRFRVLDGQPADSCHTPGLRCEDWDEPGDFGRLLRYLDWDGWSGDVKVHLGDITGVSLGHGELIYRYYNNLLLDSWQTGAVIDVQRPDWGLSALVGDVMRWDLVGLRAWGRPVPSGYWRRLRFGLQAAMDRAITASTGQQGPTTRSEGPWQVDAPLLATDLSLVAWGDDQRALTLFVSLSGHLPDSLAVHSGMGWHRRGDLAVALQLEGRLLAPLASGGSLYVPGWFGPLYELDSRSLRSDVAGNAALRTAATLGARGSLDVTRARKFRLVMVADWLADRRLDTLVWLQTDAERSLTLHAMLANRWTAQAADQPLRWTGSVMARLRVQGPWYASLSAGRKWRVRQPNETDHSPLYTEAEFRLAVGANWQF
ncbi:MAG: hypothetical protein EXR77_04890 [Myxococcales bacterium]|nr:hypothetical protein [Myxococcales bacterium]